MAELLKGLPAASEITRDLSRRSARLQEKGIEPTLAILRVGEKPDDLAYERGAIKRAQKAGIQVKSVVLPQDVQQEEMLCAIRLLNEDRLVHGVLMLRPLPQGLDETAACETLSPAKDVDGIGSGSMAHVYSGKGEGFSPCTAESVIEILRFYGIELSGKKAVVIGRSLVIGRPVAMLLMQQNATVTICHSRTEDVRKEAREADILVVAAGKKEMVDASYLRQGQIVVDVGIHYDETRGRLVGDVAFDQAEPLVSMITPVPGGVGSVTTAVLCRHVMEAAENEVSYPWSSTTKSPV